MSVVMLQLLLRMRTAFFVAESPVAHYRDIADKLMIIVSGNVGVYEAGRNHDPAARLITIGPG